uniref:Uncharacterized protein n=1 Tax=Daphnia galeata TaxID=27404 RepID=A0A8J2WNL0_9CRUS|nr:unnamed protein product [Daphnia galeata]
MLGIFCLLLALDAFIITQHFTFYGVVIVCEDYSPCVCEIYQPYGLIVHCGNANNDGQQKTVSANDVHVVERIAVNCSTTTGPLRLEIHPKAFRSSIQHIGHFEVTECDLSQLNFKYRSDTTGLMSFSFSRSVRFKGFNPLPFFSRLKSLRIYEYQDFQDWNEISVRFPNLESLFLDGTLLGDRSVNQLVSSIANSKRHTAATEFMGKPTHPHSGSHFVFQKIELR